MHGGCDACGAALAHDQRYCIDCGARRGPLPSAACDAIGALRGPAAAAPAAGTGLARSSRLAMPSPRAAAVAVFAMLAFGVIVGSLAGPVDANAPLLVALTQPAPTPTPTPSPAPAPTAASVEDTPAPAPPVRRIIVQQAAPPAPAQPASVSLPSLPPITPTLPAIQHVFLILLTDHGYDDAFGPDASHDYLGGTLARQGEVIPGYYGVASGGLANEVALISGQGPTNATSANCPQFADVAPGTLGADGQVVGDGCAYPVAAQTLGDQLVANGATWKAYVESAPSECAHTEPQPGDPWVAWRDPFAYFHSATDAPGCTTNLASLDQLDTDLAAAAKTPSFSLIVPDRCHDGSAEPCTPGAPAGLPAAGAFLKSVVPKIQASPAYKSGGLIAITFDRALQAGPTPDTSSCCNQPAYPNLTPTPPPGPTTTPAPNATPSPTPQPSPAPTTTPTPTATNTPAATTTPGATPTATNTPAATTTPVATPTATNADGTTPGGGKVGLLLLSPFVKAGSVNVLGTYNHFALLRSIEDLFGLDHLGYAADPALPAFDKIVYNGTSR